MSTSLPAISPRLAVKSSPRKDGGLNSDYNAAATRRAESVADWTPHDVAEWLYMQVGSGDAAIREDVAAVQGGRWWR
jgi:hypothetical protein